MNDITVTARVAMTLVCQCGTPLAILSQDKTDVRVAMCRTCVAAAKAEGIDVGYDEAYHKFHKPNA